jgi:orotate phosphoribosyltransferase
MDGPELASELMRRAHLRGRFRLRSGNYSDEYFDKYRFAAEPRLLSAIASGLAALLPDDTEVVAGIELGGVVIATAVDLAADKPMAFVRKTRKEYGTENLVEGAGIDGKVVCVIEDVISTGGQLIESTEALRQAGARVSTALCVVDRTGGDHRRLTESAITLVALFTSDELAARSDLTRETA